MINGIFFFYSEIYCRGELLHTVQTAKIYNDSKTFVDMKLKQSPETTLNLFKQFMNDHNNNPNRDDIRQFVEVSDISPLEIPLFVFGSRFMLNNFCFV